MRSWTEVVEGSPAWTALGNLHEAVKALQESEGGDEALERPGHLAAIAEQRLRALDPDLAFPGLLQDLATRLEGVANQLWAHFEPPEGDAAADRGAVEQSCDELAQILSIVPAGGDAEASALAEAFRRDLEGLRSQAEAMRTDLERAKSEADATHTAELEERATQANEIRTALDALTIDVVEMQTRVDDLIADRTQAFDTALSEATAAHDAVRSSTDATVNSFVADGETKLQKQLSDQEQEHKEQVDAHERLAQDSLTRINSLKDEAEELVGAVGRTGLSGGFQQWEADERSKADRLRVVAIVFGILAAISIVALLLGRSAISDEDDEFDVPLAVTSLAVPGAFFGIAGYAGRESGKHRANQVIARRTELELASFGPFIAKLDAEQQSEITALFTTVFFGQAMAPTNRDEDGGGGPKSLSSEVLSQMAAIIMRDRSGPESG